MIVPLMVVWARELSRWSDGLAGIELEQQDVPMLWAVVWDVRGRRVRAGSVFFVQSHWKNTVDIYGHGEALERSNFGEVGLMESRV